MSNHQNKYKKLPAFFEDANTGRLVRAGKQEARRKLTRAENFSRHRGVPTELETQEVQTSIIPDISSKYRRWKAEKDLKRKIEQQKKKPVFKVGIVHHKLYSPPISSRVQREPASCLCRASHKIKHQPTPPRRITRATQKRLDAKQAAAAATPAVASTSKKPSTRKESSKTTKKKCSPAAKKNLNPSFAPNDYVFRAPSGITGIPLFGRIAMTDELDTTNTQPWPVGTNSLHTQETTEKEGFELKKESATDEKTPESPSAIRLRLSTENESAEEENVKIQSPSQVPSVASTEIGEKTTPRSVSPVPASYSPYIVTSRGKNSARKEQQTRMGIGRRSSTNEIPTKETVMQNLNISVQEEEQTAQYFKHILQNETDKLNDLCAKWEAIKSDPDLSEDTGYDISAAIGQTKLLMKKKFERFRNLIHDCETGKGQMLVRCKDLGGFWDLIDREIKDCDARFTRLETLKSNDWKEEEPTVKKVTRKKAATAKVKINAKSSARSWILAARKKMSQSEDVDTPPIIAEEKPVEEDPSTTRIPASPKQNERRKSTPKTPSSLLKKVQLAEASKNTKSPLALMKISQMCKTPEVKLDESITYVNSDQTPAKSILKKSDASSGSESSLTKSSRKVVDFDDDVFVDEVPADDVDEAFQNSIDLGRALARIESYRSESDFVQPFNVSSFVTVRRIEKRLDFEDDSFDETENTDTAESATIVASNPEPSSIPDINVTSPSPDKPAPIKTPSKSKRRSSRRKSNIHEALDEEKRTSNIRVLRSSTKENSDPQRQTEKKSIGKEIILETSKIFGSGLENEDITKRRRSTRKSVRFNPDDCTACGEMAKSAQPKTPHVRRSKKISLLGDSTRQSICSITNDGDLISFDSPKKTPRARRSTCK